jgi:polysaccharide deacetylase 2 family uncharacterized protein YibQ
MRAPRPILFLLILLVATVVVMVALLRPAVFPGLAEPESLEVNEAPQVEAPEVEPGASVPPETVAPPDTGPRLYLVLDDAGQSLSHLAAFEDFPAPFTLAVLPRLPASRAVAQRASRLGHEVILHQPMEPVGDHDPGPGAILVGQSDREIQETLLENLTQIPGVVGVNNHMGSRATGDPRVMATVSRSLAGRQLYFLDSRTTAETVALKVVRAAGVPAAARDTFLDNVREETAISRQLDVALAHADVHGWSVMIGHVTSPELAQVLIDRYPSLAAAGYRFLPLSDLMKRDHGWVAHDSTGD